MFYTRRYELENYIIIFIIYHNSPGGAITPNKSHINFDK